MAFRIAVASTLPDARAHKYLTTLKDLFPDTKLNDVHVSQLYTVDADISAARAEKAAQCLTNPTTETYSIKNILAPRAYSYAIEIGYLPGVTDNVGKTAQQTIEDAIGKKFKKDEAVYTSVVIFLSGALTVHEVESFARELHNSLIERATVIRKGKELPIVVPRVHMHEAARADDVNLNVSDEELLKIGKEGILNSDGSRRGPLALSLKTLKVIRDYFNKISRSPTDIELESLAQTWSEHCKHTIFADPLDEVTKGIYKTYIKGATEKIRTQKGKKDFCVSVFKDNAGAIVFDDTYLITHKVETHNSPSALDPFGGAITGIGGVNRDCLGFGLGAKPIANVFGFCVGDPNENATLFRDKEKMRPVLSSRRILEGVIKGINAGGNQSGIPTPLGFLATDPSYNAKPLVFAGTIGLIPRKNGARKLYEKKAMAGDYVVMIGGRVGLDGIHGATFSSEALSEGSPATAVQIGDPITQKKLSDAIIREARDKNLYSSITDNGAGGLSCAVAEMARECGGCIVDLEKVPVKYAGMAPWQIWISESQERMTLSVPKKNWKALKSIFDRHDVEATIIGEFTKTKRCIVRYSGAKVMDISMDFLHDGRPREVQKGKKVIHHHTEPSSNSKAINLQRNLLKLLARPNIGSISFISRQYDHEVQGISVTKPLEGKGAVNTDAAVIQPLPDSLRGVVLSHGYAPWYSQIDTYAMAAAAIDTAVRNAIVAGGSLDHLAILDNFCWSSSSTPERLYELKRAARACYDVATAYGTPFISGKDSMFNDFRGFTAAGKPIHVAALPTLLISAIGVMKDVTKAMTIDFKMPGDSIYLIGETNNELGGSEYYALLGHIGNSVPRVDTRKNVRIYNAVSTAIEKGLLASVQSVGRGGLAAALSKSAIAGQLGAGIDLSKIRGTAKHPDAVLFSESQGRILVTVRPGADEQFVKLMKGVAFARIGEVGGETLSVGIGSAAFAVPLSELTDAYRSCFKHW